ncbi:hypothetical protein TNIN_287141 [Trichonephila inaurata madagascariensis]|uniref:Uncharacterized protein n=1 Tax=Trichonephila inaurata madagascariensis TaxID=2747483 RepID=A0A8X6XN34_9ARAC|nr:hypothetical protein TNIN_287141 [Trichonephila inaurata madagascariensis]
MPPDTGKDIFHSTTGDAPFTEDRILSPRTLDFPPGQTEYCHPHTGHAPDGTDFFHSSAGHIPDKGGESSPHSHWTYPPDTGHTPTLGRVLGPGKCPLSRENLPPDTGHVPDAGQSSSPPDTGHAPFKEEKFCLKGTEHAPPTG